MHATDGRQRRQGSSCTNSSTGVLRAATTRLGPLLIYTAVACVNAQIREQERLGGHLDGPHESAQLRSSVSRVSCDS
jgi:hypothetical protein